MDKDGPRSSIGQNYEKAYVTQSIIKNMFMQNWETLNHYLVTTIKLTSFIERIIFAKVDADILMWYINRIQKVQSNSY